MAHKQPNPPPPGGPRPAPPPNPPGFAHQAERGGGYQPRETAGGATLPPPRTRGYDESAAHLHRRDREREPAPDLAGEILALSRRVQALDDDARDLWVGIGAAAALAGVACALAVGALVVAW